MTLINAIETAVRYKRLDGYPAFRRVNRGVRTMTEVTDNMQKYGNYREQMGRLSKAMNNGFYLEAIL